MRYFLITVFVLKNVVYSWGLFCVCVSYVISREIIKKFQELLLTSNPENTQILAFPPGRTKPSHTKESHCRTAHRLKVGFFPLFILLLSTSSIV